MIGENSYDAVRLYVDKFTAALFSSEQAQRDAFFDRYNSLASNDSVIDIIDGFIGDKTRIQKNVISDALFLLRETGLNTQEISEMIHSELRV